MKLILENYLLRRTLVVLLSLSSFSLAAQSGISINGQLLNEKGEGLIGATILLSEASDSSMLGYAISDKMGNFSLETQARGKCILEISYLGLGSFARNLELQAGKRLIELGSITLLANNQVLDEFGLKADFIPIVIKKDTVEYNAAAFRSENDDVIEDLLKKLPGIEVERDGTIKAQGEEVKNILVDGKPFFEGDTKVASKNIPADIVDKIQVFDKASDLAHFTGIADNNKEKTINLKLEEGKNKGTFGKISAAGGPQSRYQGSTNINRFDAKYQLSLLGNTNNTNEQTFSLKDYLEFTGGIEELLDGNEIDFSQLPSSLLDKSGLNDRYSLGLNFNKDFANDLEIRTNYFLNANQNNSESSTKLRAPAANGFFDNIIQANENSQLNKHKLNFKLKHSTDSTSIIQVDSKSQLSHSSKSLNSNGQAILENLLLNNTEQYFENDMKNHSIDLSLQYLKKLKEGRRFYSFKTGVKHTQYDIEGLLNNTQSISDTDLSIPISNLNQEQDTWSNQLQWRGAFSFTEAIAKGQFIRGSLESKHNKGQRRKVFRDQVDTDLYVKNEGLSKGIEVSLQKQVLNINYTLQRKDYQLNIGIGPQWSQIVNPNAAENINFINNLGQLGFNYAFNKSKKLSLTVNSSVSLPSVEQLQEVEDNSDPLNIVIGNPELVPERIQQFSLNLNSFNNFYMRSIFFSINGSRTNNRIIYERTIDDELRSVNRTINGKEEWQLNGYTDYSSPLGFSKIRLKIKADQGFQKSYLSLNNTLRPYVFWNSNSSIGLDNIRKQKADLSLSYSYTIKSSIIQNTEMPRLSLLHHELRSDISIFFPKKWTFFVKSNWQFFPKNELANQDHLWILDSGIKKSIKDNKFSFFLSANNLFDERYLLQQNALGFQNIHRQKNRLGRFFLLGIQYRIRSFGT